MSDASSYLSTYLHPTIKTVEDLVYRTKSLLGSPVQDDELTDSQWVEIVSEALENYTSWGGGSKEEYLVFCANQYRRGCGVKLDELVQIGCNTQFCNQTVVVSSVTSEYVDCNLIDTKTAYLSVSPFIYPTEFIKEDRDSVEFKGTSGQTIKLFFDPKNPWNVNQVCDADCITINPVSSQFEQIQINSNLSDITLDFLNNPLLQDYASIIPEDNTDPLNEIPLSALGNSLSSVPIEVFDLSAFYPPTVYNHPPMEACVDICGGIGYIYPDCNKDDIDACAPLTAQYRISPTYEHVLTALTLTSVTVNINSIDFSTISSFFEDYCNECNCACELLTTYSSETSAFTFETVRNVISGIDGKIWDLSALDISTATHIILNDIPICVTDGLIPLDSNNGIFPTITLCNTALCTDGMFYLDNVQFVNDVKPPIEVLYEQCDECNPWKNNGFTFTRSITSHDDCISSTPQKVKVDVSFYNKELRTEVGEVSTFYSSKFDTLLNRPRKVYGVFALDNANSSGSYGGFGGDMLFNFDYALLASTFGYNLQGSRINAGMGYDLVTYHLARSFVETTKRMLRYVSYTWDERTQYLKLHPEPPIQMQADPNGDTCGCASTPMGGSGNQCYIIGVYLEAPVEELLSTYWVREYVLARAKQVLGTIRAKYTNGKLYDGTWFDASSLLQEGSTRIEKLMDELRKDNYYFAGPSFFVG